MLTYVVRRLGAGVVLLAAVAASAFLLLYLGSSDVGRTVLGPTATKDQVAAKNHELGLDRPVVARLVDWTGHAVHGDFGRSWFTGQDVQQAISARLPVTLSLVLGTMLVTIVVAVGLGLWAAVRGGWVDGLLQVFSVVGSAIPGFVVALFLVTFFSIRLRLFPTTGYVPLENSPSGWLSSITLPVVALSIAAVVHVSQQVRGSVKDALDLDWVRTLRSRGLSRRRVLLRHVLRHAGGPALVTLSMQLIGLLGGAVIVEQLFALPGIGQLAVTATGTGDLPLIMGLVVMTAVIVVIVNLAVDLVLCWLNPKVRLT
ncbi:ABC transporter permease [Streptomyces sp. NPDC051954]|uniref:ABC transporter permease n=1 Tax=unclassified Streptomyces TaxID=2593676 RepID=UPI003439B4D4